MKANVGYALFAFGTPISKIHPTKEAAEAEAFERGYVITAKGKNYITCDIKAVDADNEEKE